MRARVWICTICKDEAQMAPWFVRHYAPWVDKIIVYDEDSTDGTVDILKACPKADLRVWPHHGLDDEKFTEAVNKWYVEARSHADWVAFVDMDELLYHPNMQDLLVCTRGSVIPSEGYALISPTGWPADDGKSQIYDLVKTGVRQDNYDKKLLHRPGVAMVHTIGRHTYPGHFPRHNGVECPPSGVKLLHLHHLGGVIDTAVRNRRCYDRAVNKRYAWNYDGTANNDPKQNGSIAWVRRVLSNNELVKVI